MERQLPLARDRSVPQVDTTLPMVGLAPDAHPAMFPIGTVVTAAVDVARSELTAPGDGGAVLPGKKTVATVTLVLADGSPGDVIARALCVCATVAPLRKSGGGDAAPAKPAAASAAGPSGSGTFSRFAVEVTLTRLSPGVCSASFTCPADDTGTRTGARLILEARMKGVHLSGSPVELAVRPPVEFDPTVGTARSISVNGCRLKASTPSGHAFRGRTHALHTGPGVRMMDIILEIVLEPDGSNYCSIVLGAPAADPTNYSSNTGHAFFLDTYYGTVNLPRGSSGGRASASWCSTCGATL